MCQTRAVREPLTVKRPDGALLALTNKQVLSYDGESPAACIVDFPNGSSVTVLPADIASDTNSIEVGTLRLTNLDAATEAAVTKLASGRRRTCATARIGDEVVVLGYPFAGSTDLVATQGIIAGTDVSDRYGSAIDVPGECYLGMIASITPAGSASVAEIWKWQEFSGDVQGQL
jgi:hypothetical protein